VTVQTWPNESDVVVGRNQESSAALHCLRALKFTDQYFC
jgi:hypothetical protein